jgi:hypothetical protein
MSSVVGALLLVARNETGMMMSGLVYRAMYIRVMIIDRYSLLFPNLFAFGSDFRNVVVVGLVGNFFSLSNPSF